MTEAQHQAAVFKWSQLPDVRQRYPELKLLHHIPNGGRRDPVEAKHLKQQGVKSGVPDLCLPVARRDYHGLYIEMKTETGNGGFRNSMNSNILQLSVTDGRRL